MNKAVDVIRFTDKEFQRFKDALTVCYAFPFIDGVEDYVLEAVFEYARKIDGVDPVLAVRSKRLYDVVDERQHIGWSVKSIQVANIEKRDFELVIQRADIFKKASELGQDELSKESSPQDLGNALMAHWEKKVREDAICQKVEERRIFIMLKAKKPAWNFAIYEAPLHVRNKEDIVWNWSDETKTGLQGRDKKTGRCVHRWYPGQKQFFECFTLPDEIEYFDVQFTRIQKERVVRLVSKFLQSRS